MAVYKQQLTNGYSRATNLLSPTNLLDRIIPNPAQGNNKSELASLTGTLTSGSLTSIAIGTAGKGYIVQPQIVVGTEWAANTAITANTQIFYGANLYNVTVSGTTSTTPPTDTSGGNIVDGTATYRWIGLAAKVSAVINGNNTIGGELTLVIDNKGSAYPSAPALTVVGGTFAPDLPVEGAFIQCYAAATYTIKVLTLGGETIKFTLSAGSQTLPVLVTKVFSADTTATEIIAMW
jgi:hypothetical protein